MDFYEEIAEWYDLIYRKRDYRSMANLFDEFFKEHGNVKDVLDVGCGTGTHAKYLCDKGYRVTGVDKSENMIKIARKKVPEAKFMKGDMENLSSGKTFDAVLCIFNTINSNITMEGLYRSLININSLLKPGGLLIFDSGLSERNMKRLPMRYLFNSDGKRSVFCLSQANSVAGNRFVLSSLILKKENGKTDMDVYDKEMGAFSLGELKRALSKTGFSYRIYESYNTKRYSILSRNRTYPMFVAEKL